MKRILISEFMDKAAVSGLRDGFNVLYDPELVDKPDRLMEEIKTADAIIVRNRTQVSASLLDNAEKLKAVGRLGVGLDNIDLKRCREMSIDVFPALGTNNEAVAEYVIASVFMLFRGAFLSTGKVIRGKWPRASLMGNEIKGKVLGIIGFGATGRRTCEKAEAMGMRVMAFDPLLKPDDPACRQIRMAGFEQLLTDADVISLHIPLTEKNRNLIDERAIGLMKDGALLINTSRGGIVDEEALLGAMKSGRIGGAALDVFENEPLTEEQGKRFEGLSNIILTPHIAGVTVESNIRASAMTAENIRNALSR